MLNFLFKMVVFFRKILEPLTWILFRQRKWKSLKDLEYWDVVKNLSIDDFNARINRFPYKSDKGLGLFDFSFPTSKPEYFFKDLRHGRDCDDWSRIWVCYCKYWNKPVQEWVVTSKRHPFKNSHFVAVMRDQSGYRLLNYKCSKIVHKTVKEALSELSNWNSCYSDDARLQCLYKKY